MVLTGGSHVEYPSFGLDRKLDSNATPETALGEQKTPVLTQVLHLPSSPAAVFRPRV
jgi:hypothetical protein